MAMDPQMMAQMLMQGQQGQNPQPTGGVVPKQGIAATAAQTGSDFLKTMMLKNMMQGQQNPMQQMLQQKQANGMMPQTNQMIQADPRMQALQSPQLSQ